MPTVDESSSDRARPFAGEKVCVVIDVVWSEPQGLFMELAENSVTS